MKFLKHFRLIPMLVIVSLLSFVVRIGDFMTGLSQSGSAYAQQEVEAEAPPMPAKDEAATAAAPEVPATEAVASADTKPKVDLPVVPAATPAAEEKKDDAAETEAKEGDGELKPAWRDAGDAEFEYSDVQQGMYKDLADRRKAIEVREKQLKVREALLEAGEKELSQKLTELTSIRDEIKQLLQQQTDEEKSHIQSLVKIYEGMKAKDAANIFNTLDINVLMRIVAAMSERKSAPILAAMDPDRARTITILLAQQKQLPTLVP